MLKENNSSVSLKCCQINQGDLVQGPSKMRYSYRESTRFQLLMLLPCANRNFGEINIGELLCTRI